MKEREVYSHLILFAAKLILPPLIKLIFGEDAIDERDAVLGSVEFQIAEQKDRMKEAKRSRLA